METKPFRAVCRARNQNKLHILGRAIFTVQSDGSKLAYFFTFIPEPTLILTKILNTRTLSIVSNSNGEIRVTTLSFTVFWRQRFISTVSSLSRRLPENHKKIYEKSVYLFTEFGNLVFILLHCNGRIKIRPLEPEGYETQDGPEATRLLLVSGAFDLVVTGECTLIAFGYGKSVILLQGPQNQP